MNALGKTAYEAYREHRQGKSHNGTPIPEWDQVDPGIQAAWATAAAAVVTAVVKPDQLAVLELLKSPAKLLEVSRTLQQAHAVAQSLRACALGVARPRVGD